MAEHTGAARNMLSEKRPQKAGLGGFHGGERCYNSSFDLRAGGDRNRSIKYREISAKPRSMQRVKRRQDLKAPEYSLQMKSL